MSFAQRLKKIIIKPLASLKIAVVTILTLAVLLAVGTIIEAQYNSEIAKKLVYDTYMMYGVLGVLSCTLISVMVDRWPWKRKHISFILAHIGILLLLAGAWITASFGVDGSMRVELGRKSQQITLPETELTLWSSYNGDQYAKLFESTVDFYTNRPEKKPWKFPVDKGEVAITGYRPFVLASKKWIESENIKSGSALRFQIQNSKANVIEWVSQKKAGESGRFDLGPLAILLGEIPKEISPGKNTIFIYDDQALKGQLKYSLFGKDGKVLSSGVTSEGKVIQTPWMGSELRVLRFLSKAEEIWEFKDLDRPTPISTSAIQVEFDGKKHWLQQNDVLKLFTENSVYILTFGQKRIDIGFGIELVNFEIGRYQGTNRAASYQSEVQVPGVGLRTISMNEPLKFNGYTVFQASFEENEMGQPTASIFSINKDPGVFFKYLGSLILSLGVIWLFVDKRKTARAMAPK